MNLSVVVTTYERNDDLLDCLESLVRQFEPPSEVVVVNDGDVRSTKRRIEEAELNGGKNMEIRHITGEKAGLPAARNQGVEAATGDIICFVDDDVVLPPNWTRELKTIYEEYPDAAGVGGYVLNFNPAEINKANTDSFGYRLLQGIRKVFLYNRVGEISPVGVLYAPLVFMTTQPRPVDALQGCNMSFRAEVFDSHRFDEWYGESGSSANEEVDLAVRVSHEGGDLIYNPRLVVLHKRSVSEDIDARTGGPNYGNVTNLAYFLLKWPKGGAGNLVLLASVMMVYSLIKRDVGYLIAIKEGITEYSKHGRSDPSTASGTSSRGYEEDE